MPDKHIWAYSEDYRRRTVEYNIGRGTIYNWVKVYNKERQENSSKENGKLYDPDQLH